MNHKDILQQIIDQGGKCHDIECCDCPFDAARGCWHSVVGSGYDGDDGNEVYIRAAKEMLMDILIHEALSGEKDVR